MENSQQIKARWREKEQKIIDFYTANNFEIKLDEIYDRISYKMTMNKKLIKKYLSANTVKLQLFMELVKKANILSVENKMHEFLNVLREFQLSIYMSGYVLIAYNLLLISLIYTNTADIIHKNIINFI